MEKHLIKPYEFWHPRIFEAPYYVYLGVQCLLHGIGIRTLAKANYGLDHGEIGIGSKYASQLAFKQDYFMPTTLVKHCWTLEQKKSFIIKFAEVHAYPVILKSDVGCVGKGISKISNLDDVKKTVPLLIGDYILQKFSPHTYECGIFYVRRNGVARITGINKKHFPTVIGNGKDTIYSLAQSHKRYSHHWSSFLQYIHTERVPQEGEEVCLSFIGSHTLGCKFTDDTHLITPALEQSVYQVFADQPGFNFGRVDIKAESEQALQAGEFVVIEVNGIASLPTHMFDPKFSLIQGYSIFFEHGKYLAEIAYEHRHRPMDLLPLRDIVERVKTNQGMLNEVHEQLKEGVA